MRMMKGLTFSPSSSAIVGSVGIWSTEEVALTKKKLKQTVVSDERQRNAELL